MIVKHRERFNVSGITIG